MLTRRPNKALLFVLSPLVLFNFLGNLEKNLPNNFSSPKLVNTSTLSDTHIDSVHIAPFALSQKVDRIYTAFLNKKFNSISDRLVLAVEGQIFKYNEALISAASYGRPNGSPIFTDDILPKVAEIRAVKNFKLTPAGPVTIPRRPIESYEPVALLCPLTPVVLLLKRLRLQLSHLLPLRV